MKNIHSTWKPLILSLLREEKMASFLQEEFYNAGRQPKKDEIFKVFDMPLQDIKVVILGPEPSTALQMSKGYSLPTGFAAYSSRSLTCIDQEIRRSDPERINSKNLIDIESWVEQGVFMLNASLTVETGNPGSDRAIWRDFTERVVQHISFYNPCIWVLWGTTANSFHTLMNLNPFYVKNYDRETIKNIPSNTEWNYILQSDYPVDHPANSFMNSDQFYFVNEILTVLKKKQIIW